MLDLYISHGVEGHPHVPSDEQLQNWAEAALQATERTGSSELAIRIVDEAEMAELNEQFRNKQGPTNVLSFPYDPIPGVELPMLGDLAICIDVVETEAKDQCKTLEAHWAHMVIHGVLHLCGHDHIEEDEAVIMESLETKILAAMGFPDPYHDRT